MADALASSALPVAPINVALAARGDLDLIANLVVQNGKGQVLLARYNRLAKSTKSMLTNVGGCRPMNLTPTSIRDDAAKIALEEIGGVNIEELALSRVQSFRGRRGWHVSFDYRVDVSGEPDNSTIPASWFPVDELPQMMHGNWERDTIDAVVST